jgi:signal transduction histidine kinase
VSSPPTLIDTRVRRALPAGAYLLLAAATVAIVRSDPEFALAGGSGAALAAEIAAGALVIAAALLVWRSGALFPWLLAAAALAWPLAEWNTPAAGAAFTAGLVLYTAWPPLLTAAALRGPDERRLDRPAAVVLAFAFAVSVGLLGIASTVVFDARAAGCPECPANRLLVAGHEGARYDLGQWGLALSVAWAAGFGALAVARLARSSPARRRLVAPVLVPSVAAVALFAADALHGLQRGFLSSDATDRALWKGQIAALALVAAGAAWGRVRVRRTRAALARLVVELGASPSPGGLQVQLATVLGDPSLEMLHCLDDGVRWVDADGRAATLAAVPGREVTRITAGGRGLSALVHCQGLLDDPAMVEEIAVAVRLALDHERLRATRRAQLEDLRKSRSRIVVTADAERRRLERDLHDGAQQRLVTLAIGVRLARRAHAADDPGLDEELAAGEAELRGALAALRGLAHGLFPAALDEEGLAAAIELLAEAEPRLVLGALPGERCSPPVESAAYYLIDEVLRLAPAGDVSVDTTRRDGRLIVDLSAASAFAQLPVRVEDRIGAVGGTVVGIASHVRAELPCGS